MGKRLTIGITVLLVVFNTALLLCAYYLPEGKRVVIIGGMALVNCTIVAVTLITMRQYGSVWTSVFANFQPPDEDAEKNIEAALIDQRMNFHMDSTVVSLPGFDRIIYNVFVVGGIRITLQDALPGTVYVGPLREDNHREVERLKGLVERALGAVKD